MAGKALRDTLRAANIVAVNVALLIGLLVLIEVASYFAFELKGILAPGDSAELPPRYLHESHEGHRDWVPQMIRDSKGMKLDYRVGLWEPPDYVSETVNAREGARSSGGESAAGGPDADAKSVFIFGGSTMWGVGVRDDYTIPAYLNQLGRDRYRFLNYGVPAYQSTQEILRLSLLLRDGKVPDLVVFYDGANDAVYGARFGPGYEMRHGDHAEKLAGSAEGILSSLAPKSNAWKIVNSLRSKLDRQRQQSGPAYVLTEEDRVLAERSVEIYLNSVRFVKRLGEAYDFEVVALLQPVLFAGYEYDAGVVTDFERTLYESQDRRVRAIVRAFYEKAAESGEVIDLSRTLVDAGEAGNYYDALHLGPRSNEVVAGAIYGVLQDRSATSAQ